MKFSSLPQNKKKVKGELKREITLLARIILVIFPTGQISPEINPGTFGTPGGVRLLIRSHLSSNYMYLGM